jgi:hypothetical protein
MKSRIKAKVNYLKKIKKLTSIKIIKNSMITSLITKEYECLLYMNPNG